MNRNGSIFRRKALQLLLFCLTIGAALLFMSLSHKFYVSLTEIKINEYRSSIEISLRVFPDDMDLALEELKGVNPQLATEFEHDSADVWLENYLLDHFSILADGKAYSLEFLGKEIEGDAIWCYLEAKYDSFPGEVLIFSSVLTEIFEEQKNIIQIYHNSFNKGLLFTADHQSEYVKLK